MVTPLQSLGPPFLLQKLQRHLTQRPASRLLLTPQAPRPLCTCPSPPGSPSLLGPQSWDTVTGTVASHHIGISLRLCQEFSGLNPFWFLKISNKVDVSKTRRPEGFSTTGQATSSDIQNKQMQLPAAVEPPAGDRGPAPSRRPLAPEPFPSPTDRAVPGPLP